MLAATQHRLLTCKAAETPSEPHIQESPVARRCLMPAGAFYEWRTMGDGKQPYTITRTDCA